MELGRIAQALNEHFRHSSIPLEAFNGFWDVWWATWILLFGSAEFGGAEYQSLINIFPLPIWLGVPVLVIGVLQLWAVKWSSREVRSNLALLSGILWISILSLIIAGHGTITGPYMVNYGMAALGEIWVFLRLTRPWA